MGGNMTRHSKKAPEPLSRNTEGLVSGYNAAFDPTEAETPRSRRVLLIEDDPAALALLAMWLGDHGFSVQEFKSLKQAMHSLEDRLRHSVH
jgi:PleD family two-component response regulator